MNKTEFESQYARARKTYNSLGREVLRQVKGIYEQAATEVAEIVRRAEEKDLSTLTSGSWKQIESKLRDAAELIAQELEERIKQGVGDGADIYTRINENYLFDVVDLANGKITKSGISNMFFGLDTTVVESMVNRVMDNGYTFSERIWDVADVFQKQIKDIISVGIASGRDIIDIARDIEVYVRSGREALAKRYGKLVGREFRKRIRKGIDYNALRLIRSELYMSLQDASVRAGDLNPAGLDLYDWKRNTSEDWGCQCPELEDGSPYAKDEIPAYPHPNCLCHIVPRLRDSREFQADLKLWVKGEKVPYLDKWYKTKYAA